MEVKQPEAKYNIGVVVVVEAEDSTVIEVFRPTEAVRRKTSQKKFWPPLAMKSIQRPTLKKMLRSSRRRLRVGRRRPWRREAIEPA